MEKIPTPCYFGFLVNLDYGENRVSLLIIINLKHKKDKYIVHLCFI